MEAPTSRSGGYDTLSIAAADLNGDNKVDMVLVNDDGTVSVLLGNGDGTFTTAVNYEAGGGATSYQNSPVPTITPNLVAIADVNGDGKPDLLVTSTCAADDCSSGSVGVLLGNGDGTFRPAVSYGSGGSIATSVAVADVNGDGNLDLLVANDCTSIDGNGNCLGAETVGVLLGKGDGTFRNAVVYPSGGYYGNDSASASVVAADLNGDGAPDLVVSNNCTSVDSNGFCLDTGTVGVLLNNGAGTFLPAVVYATGGRDPGPPAILADPNGGSRSAIAVANLCSLHDCVSDSPVGVLLGNGDGTFQSAVVYDSGGNSATQVVVAYVNGDINPDLLVLSQCSDNCEGNGIVGVLLGGFKWSFSSPLTYDAGGSATSLTSADVNGDGNLDLLIANASDNLNTNFGAFGVLLGDGTGKFQGAPYYGRNNDFPQSVAVADINLDGYPDVIVLNQYSSNPVTGSLNIFVGNGDGSFQQPTQPPFILNSDGYLPNAVTTADLDGNGTPDMVVADNCQDIHCNNGGVEVWLSLWGPFTSGWSHTDYNSGGYDAVAAAIADVNGDGKLDLLVANACASKTDCSAGSVGVLLGKGDGTFQPVVTYGSGGSGGANSVAVADLNGDGKPDLIVANGCNGAGCSNSGAVSVLLGNGDGTFRPAVDYSPGPYLAYWATTADMNGDGIPDLVVADYCACAYGAVSVLLGNGDGTFQPWTATFTPQINHGPLVVTDFDGNGTLDVASGSGDFLLLGAVGGTTFQSPLDLGARGVGIALGDFNGDGGPDLAVGGFNVLLNRTARKLPTSTNVTSSPNPSVPGQSVTFTATVAANGAGTPTGSVIFNNSGIVLGTANLVDGVATFTVSNIAGLVNAVYTGDATFQHSSGGVNQVVNISGQTSPTTTALSSSMNPSSFGQTVSFTATVTPQGTGTPTGTVTFTDGATTLDTVALDAGGSASVTVSGLATGMHMITANYSGDANFASSSASLNQTIVSNLKLELTSSADPSGFGQSVTFAAVLYPIGGGTATGTVTFTDGTTTLGVVDVSGNAAALSTSTLASGSHAITAVYSGDDTFSTSSAAVTQVVGTTATAPTITYQLVNTYPLANLPTGNGVLALADVNNDGNPDAIVLSGSSTINVLLGDGAGNLAATATYDTGAAGPINVQSGDLNGDGFPDLIVTSCSAAGGTCGSTNGNSGSGSVISVLLNTGSGTFNSPVIYPSGGAVNTAARIYDVNGDGIPDLVVQNSCTTLDTACDGGSVSIMFGNGDGTFQSAQPYYTPPSGYRMGTFAVADLNNDGRTDIVVLSAPAIGNTSIIAVLLQNPDGTFATQSYTLPMVLNFLRLVDVNADGNVDLLLNSYSTGGAYVQLGNGDGTFGAATNFGGTAEYSRTNLQSADLNGDGLADIVIGVGGVNDSGTVGVLQNNSTPSGLSFLPVQTYASGGAQGTAQLRAIRLADLNGDGLPDIVVTNVGTAGNVSVLLAQVNNPQLSSQTITFSTNAPANAAYGSSFTVVASASSGLPVTFTSSGSCTNSGATYTMTSGTGTCSVIADQAGDSNYLPAPTVTETVNATPASLKLQLTSNADPSGSGQSVTFAAVLYPTGGGTATGTVTFIDGATSLGVQNLSGNAASLTIGTLTAGSHFITAIYSGDDNFNTSSAAVTQVVGTTATAPTITYQLVNTYPLANLPTGNGALALADVNNDGNGDAIVLSGSNTINVLLGDGAGNLSAPVTYSTGASGIVNVQTGDLNGDGFTDLVVTSCSAVGGVCGSVTGNSGSSSIISILLNTGSGTFSPAVTYPSGGSVNTVARVFDMNGDGVPDLVVVNACTVPNTSCDGGNISILFGNGTGSGNGTFQSAQPYYAPPSGYHVANFGVGDLNNDGRLDIVVYDAPNSGTTRMIGVMLQNSDGTFTTQNYTLSMPADFVRLIDVNGDGNMDLVLNSFSMGGAYVELGNGDGTFGTATSFSGTAESSRTNLQSADMNGDGLADIVIGVGGVSDAGMVGVLFNNTTSSGLSFLPVQTYPSGGTQGTAQLRAIRLADLNGDGLPDIVVTNVGTASNVSVLLAQVNNPQLSSQTITFSTNAPANAAYGSSFTVVASASSGLPVTFTSSGSCTNSGATYTMTSGTGTCSVIADQAGNSNYLAAPTVTETVNATPVAQTISFSTNAPATAAFNTSFTVAATASSGLAIAFTSSGSCTNSGATYTITSGTGTCLVFADQAGNSNYQAAPTVTQSVNVTNSSQTITFTTNAPASAGYGSSFTVAATASSGLTVTFTSSGSCTNSGATYTMTSSTGTCSVIANQAGNSNYGAAPTVTQHVAATKASQTITFTTSAPATAVYTSSFTVAAIASSGLAVTFTHSGSCTNSGTTYTMTIGTGTCSVIASQAGNTNYSAAPSVTQTVTATKIPQTITFTQNAPASAGYNSSFQVAATASSGLAVTFTHAGSCTNTGVTYTMTSGTGTCSVIASQAGNTDYSAAPTVTESVTATALPTTVVWSDPSAITYGTKLSATQLNASATPVSAGKYVYSPASGALLAAGTQTLSVTFTPTNAGYASSTGSVTLTVNQATPKITWAKPAAITYGTALGTKQLNATASVPGTFVYSPAAGTILTAGTQTLTVTFTPTDATDYATVTASVLLVVNKAVPVLAWAKPAAITYGTALGGQQLDATTSVAGTMIYSPAAGTVLKAGTQKLMVTFMPTDTTDYDTNSLSVSITVNKAVPTISWPTPAPITYGTPLSATQLDATTSVPGTFAYSPVAGTIPSVGTHTLKVTFTPTDTSDYLTATASVTLIVN